MRILVFLLAFVSLSAYSQEFPKDWIGKYSGTMIIGSLERPNDSVLVTFDVYEIDPDSSWSYLMTFQSPKYGDIVKDYIIRKSNDGNSKSYLLDEQDGIILDMSLLNNSFYSVFELNQTLYTSTLRRTPEGIYFDLFVTPQSTSLKSAPEADEQSSDEEQVQIEVMSYKTVMHQSVLLKKHE